MKTIKIFALFLGLLPLMAGAQSNASKISDKAALERNFAKTLWFNTNNAAGMSVSPLLNYADVSIGYDRAQGQYKQMQQGELENNVYFHTTGAVVLDKVALWGEFSFKNLFIDSTLFNTTAYDPLEDDMPYYVADANKSYWTKQAYDMQMKAAFSINDVVSLGANIIYSNRIAAKQIDPRSENYQYFITVKPSATFKIGNHTIGFNLLYKNLFERTNPMNSDSQTDQRVFILKGLGNYSIDIVGGNNSVGILYYKTNRYGLGLQYGLDSAFELLFDGGCDLQMSDVFQSPTRPQAMGSTMQMYIYANVQTLFGSDKSNKITLNAFHRSTDGTEYVTKYNNTTSSWDITSENVKSNYLMQKAVLSYDKYLGPLPSYTWNFGGSATFSNRSDEYFIPNSTFKAMNAYAQIYGKKNFDLNRCNILFGLRGGYNYNLAGGYSYRGTCDEAVTVTTWLRNDINILTSNYIKAGCDLDISFKINSKIATRLGGTFDYILPDIDNKSRLIANISLGMIF